MNCESRKLLIVELSLESNKNLNQQTQTLYLFIIQYQSMLPFIPFETLVQDMYCT
jgi:hypothetical protein